MKLRKRDLPSYEIELPVSGQIISYRPYTVKEEKILDLASLSGKTSEKYGAVKQIIENCSNANIKEMHPADVDYLYMKIYAASESSELKFNYNIDYNLCKIQNKTQELYESDCPKEITGVLNIDTSVHVINIDEMKKLSDTARGAPNSRIVDLVDGYKLHLGYKTLDLDITSETIDVAPILYELLIAVIDGDDVIPKEEFTLEEFIDFYSHFTPSELENLREYFMNSARCVANLKVKCNKCKKEFESEQSGLLNFLI